MQLKTKPAFCMLLIILILPSHVRASSTLTITVATSSQDYSAREDIEIFGNLTLNGLPFQALVAIQVDDPDNATVAVRTQETGTNPIVGLIEIVEAFPCDPFTGAPKSSFDTGELFGLKVTVNNTDSIPHYVLVVVNAYDASGVTLGTSAGMGQATPGERFFILAIPIPTSAYTGNATAYAGVYTDWPKNGGVPYCPEMSTQFEIISQQGSGGQSSPTQISENGTYNLTFKLPLGPKLGNYTVFVSSTYQGIEVTESTTFNVYALPGDANGDGIVDLADLLIFLDSWTKKPGDLGYDPRADFDRSGGYIDLADLLIFLANWSTGI